MFIITKCGYKVLIAQVDENFTKHVLSDIFLSFYLWYINVFFSHLSFVRT